MRANSLAITALSDSERANDYPYQAPSYSYLMEGDRYARVTGFTQADLAGRVAVLSVGSNRAPQQLLRKFAGKARLPVTRALLKNCDIIHSACFSYYGAVPCSAYPSFGTDIMLNAVWLTAQQLQIMHDTEAVGIAYDYCRWDEGAVEILDAPQPQAVYGYATRLGYLADEARRPFGLSALPAMKRQFTSLSQAGARSKLYQSLLDGLPNELPIRSEIRDETSFIEHLIADKAYRLEVNEALAALSVPIEGGPWQIIRARPTDADRFL